MVDTLVFILCCTCCFKNVPTFLTSVTRVYLNVGILGEHSNHICQTFHSHYFYIKLMVREGDSMHEGKKYSCDTCDFLALEKETE